MNVNTYGRASEIASMDASNASRIVLDSNVGITNVAAADQLKQYIIDTFADISNLLAAHCGPKSAYAMIVTGLGNSDFEPNIFTKDGIKILSFIEYTAPIQAYMKEALAYIGKRVDNVAKDGTTTSILFAAQFLKSMLEHSGRFDDLTTTAREEIFKSIAKDVHDMLVAESYSVEDLPHRSEVAAGMVGFMQAMSSSGGNTVLAKVIYEIFANSPREAWDRMLTTQSTMESDIPFEVRYQECDYSLFSNMINDQLRNTDLNTRYVEKDVLVFAYPDDIHMGTTVMDRVGDWLEAIPENRAAAILAQEVDGKLVQFINNKNKTRTKPISIFCNLERDKYSKTSWDILAILSMAGKRSYAEKVESVGHIHEAHTFVASRIEFNGTHLELFDFYEVDPNSNLHPYYINPESFVPYTELLNNINKVIQFSRDGHVKDNRMIESAYRIFKQMVCVKSPSLWIGGTTHENISNLAVVQDAMGASMASTTTRYLTNGLLSFNAALYKLLEVYSKDSSDPIGGYKKNVVNIMIHALSHVIRTVYGDIPKAVKDDILTKDGYCNALYEESTITPLSFMDYVESIPRIIVGGETKIPHGVSYPVLQPIGIYDELLARTNELLVRLMATDKFIAPGGAFLRSNSEKE